MKLGDTSDRVRRMQLDAYRAMTGQECLELAAEMSASAFDLTKEGIRMRHPGISEAELMVEFNRILHGDEVAEFTRKLYEAESTTR